MNCQVLIVLFLARSVLTEQDPQVIGDPDHGEKEDFSFFDTYKDGLSFNVGADINFYDVVSWLPEVKYSPTEGLTFSQKIDKKIDYDKDSEAKKIDQDAVSKTEKNIRFSANAAVRYTLWGQSVHVGLEVKSLLDISVTAGMDLEIHIGDFKGQAYVIGKWHIITGGFSAKCGVRGNIGSTSFSVEGTCFKTGIPELINKIS